MGLHFHGHRARTYKEQGREEVRTEHAAQDPFDALRAELDRHVLTEESEKTATDAQRKLSHAAVHMKQAIYDYRHCHEVINANTPKP